jgi:outer membrane protein TolC
MILVALKILMLAAGANAAPSAFDWEEVRNAAESRNPGLLGAEKSWQSARSAKKATYGAFLPTVSLSARRTKTITEIATIESTSKSRLYSVAASWNLFNGFATVASVQRAGAQEEESLATKDVTSVELRYQLRRAFFSVYIQQERIKLYEKMLKRQQQNEKLVSLKHESGTEARWNVLKAKADRERAEYNLASAKSELLLARDNMAKLLNLEALPEKPVAIPATTTLLASAATPGALEGHPSLRRSRANAEKVGRDITLARSAFLPTLDLAYTRSRETSEIGSRPRTDSNSFAIVAQWQIFNGLSDFHKVQQANLTYEAAELEREKVERELQTTVLTAGTNLKTATAGLPSATSQREAAEERVRTVSAQYRSGLKTYLEWEQAEALLIDYEQAEMSALNNALNALAEYERAAGITLEQP